MNVVYKITNLINQKSYIGSSVRVEKRWQQHKSDAFNPNNDKYNYPLYQAFRKYGLENFSFEIIKDDFLTIEDMQKYEQDMILANHTLAPNGYNQTTQTTSNTIAYENTQKYIQNISKKCALVDNKNNILAIYPSYHAAARAQGWDGDKRANTIRNICLGKIRDCNGLIFRLLDDNDNIIIPVFQTEKRRTKVIGIKKDNPDDVVIYNSISEAARCEKLDRNSISLCMRGSTRYSHVGGRIWRKGDD